MCSHHKMKTLHQYTCTYSGALFLGHCFMKWRYPSLKRQPCFICHCSWLKPDKHRLMGYWVWKQIKGMVAPICCHCVYSIVVCHGLSSYNKQWIFTRMGWDTGRKHSSSLLYHARSVNFEQWVISKMMTKWHDQLIFTRQYSQVLSWGPFYLDG